MKPWLIAVLVIVCLVAVLFAWLATWWTLTRKKLNHYQNLITQAKAGIDSALEKRYGLLEKMYAITNEYNKDSDDSFEKHIGFEEERIKGNSANNLSFLNSKLDKAAHDADVIFEKNPGLKSNLVFLKLQAASRDCEEHLQSSRRVYNSNVKEYNQKLSVFPVSFVSSFYRLQAFDFFGSEEKKRSNVTLDF